MVWWLPVLPCTVHFITYNPLSIVYRVYVHLITFLIPYALPRPATPFISCNLHGFTKTIYSFKEKGWEPLLLPLQIFLPLYKYIFKIYSLFTFCILALQILITAQYHSTSSSVFLLLNSLKLFINVQHAITTIYSCMAEILIKELI